MQELELNSTISQDIYLKQLSKEEGEEQNQKVYFVHNPPS
jgi:hypothetical protein